MGAIQSPPDTRDFMMKAILKAVKFPDHLDYTDKMPPVRYQGEKGACVAFATCAVKEFQEQRERPKLKSKFDLSEEWVYRQIKVEGGGAYMRDGFKIIQHNGVPKEHYMPYVDIPDHKDNLKFEFPTAKAERVANMSARHYKVQNYARITSVDGICESLFVNGVCMIGINWLTGWFYPTSFVGKLPILKPRQGSDAGGHAFCIVGYNYPEKYFICRNSWGEEWYGGYFLASFDVINSSYFDIWSAVDVTKAQVKKGALKELKEGI